jgi:hypothetical protein
VINNDSSSFVSNAQSKSIDLSKLVGETKGTAGVSTTGGATYAIPIFVSPGTNGLEPKIALVYNSQSGDGIAGLGWNLAGLSMITRSGKNRYHNGNVSPVSYTYEDAFLMDGTRLNNINGLNGGNGTIYALETENFSKIESFTTGSSNNPD